MGESYVSDLLAILSYPFDNSLLSLGLFVAILQIGFIASLCYWVPRESILRFFAKPKQAAQPAQPDATAEGQQSSGEQKAAKPNATLAKCKTSNFCSSLLQTFKKSKKNKEKKKKR